LTPGCAFANSPRLGFGSLARLGSALRMRAVLFVLTVLLAGCTKYYWESPGRDVIAFQADSEPCIQEAIEKDRANVAAGLESAGREKIYKRCMVNRGWKRTERAVGLDHQFRGPEDDVEFDRPPSPTSGVRYWK
jgi:hypothetical protein